jgi:hypothetical protein
MNTQDNSEHSLTTTSSKGIPWPLGGTSQKYLVLNLPGITSTMLTEAIGFISNCCFVFGEKNKKKKSFLGLPGIKNDMIMRQKCEIKMVNLLKDGIIEGTNKRSNVDKYRFQSAPEEADKLKSNRAICDIVTRALQIIHLYDQSYSVAKFGILYSKAKGKPQGKHLDENRMMEEITVYGEMVTAIVPIMANTSLDVFDNEGNRNRITISPHMMIIFSGDLMHGGADYKESNVRLHIYFTRKAQATINDTVGVGVMCPFIGCKLHDNKHVFTRRQLHDHWQHYHRAEGLTLQQYKAQSEGRLFSCDGCNMYSIGERSLIRHKKRCRAETDPS